MTPELEERLHNALHQVQDPEIPISLRDLGVLRDAQIQGNSVRVTLVPTRLACPGKAMMAARITAAAHSVAPNASVEILWANQSWRPDSITTAGRQKLKNAGYTTPTDGQPDECPYCGSQKLRREGTFGGSPCKAPLTCETCGSTVDILRGTSCHPHLQLLNTTNRT